MNTKKSIHHPMLEIFRYAEAILGLEEKKTRNIEFINTLNVSGLATSGLIPAMVEQFQQMDGSVLVPDVLQKWIGTWE